MKIKTCLSILLPTVIFFFACKQNNEISRINNDRSEVGSNYVDETKIGAMLDSFNRAAALADYTTYFSFMATDAIFIGTDATELWHKEEFMVWAKPYFDKKSTWDFRSFDRHIYFDKYGDIAWFDELLSTGMKICRGSGVVIKQKNEWKIKQYVLSMTIPNSLTDKVVKLKTPVEDSLISSYK